MEQYRDITYTQSLDLKDPLYIDVRSPSEHHKAAIPGAVNLPLFDDDEREIIGLIYQKDPRQARIKGLSFASPKLPQMVEKIQAFSRENTPVLYCWRGGMRSKSLCLLLQMMNIGCYCLKGGYKAYRKFILERLNSYEITQKVYVLTGLTGVGKTRVLHLLAEMGCPTIDLEGMAQHRGSMFGHLGKNPQSQKNFDSLLWERLKQLEKYSYIAVEGEGKRIGSIFVPDFLINAIKEGEHILLKAPIEGRAERILQEYYPTTPEEIAEVESALQGLEKYIGRKNLQHFLYLLRNNQFYELVYELCEHYYDRLYKESREKQDKYILTVDATDPGQAAKTIMEFLEPGRGNITQEKQQSLQF